MTVVSVPGSHAVLRNLPYARPAGFEDLLLDLYLPSPCLPQASAQSPAPGPLPVIIFLHGGGWRFGDRTTAPDLGRYFAADGYAMVSIDYRLTPRAHFPDPVEDVKAAIRWVRAHAAEYGFDPARIGLWGSSAGAHLGVIAALSGPGNLEGDGGNGEQSSDVAAVVAGYGSYEILELQKDRHSATDAGADPEAPLAPAGSYDDADSFNSLLIGAPTQQRPDLARAASASRWIRADGPPILLVHGSADDSVGPAQSDRVYRALEAAGAPVTYALLHGLGHGFFNRAAFSAPATVCSTVDASWLDGTDGFGMVSAFFDRQLSTGVPAGRI